jgi:hypothetical protein
MCSPKRPMGLSSSECSRAHSMSKPRSSSLTARAALHSAAFGTGPNLKCGTPSTRS